MSNPKSYHEKVAEYYNRDSKGYETRFEINRFLQKIRQSFHDITSQYPFESALDIGCGPGFDLEYFGKRYPKREFHGVDISPGMITQATQRTTKANLRNVILHVGDVEHLSEIFPSPQFDMVYSYFGAMNTVKDLKAAAKSIASVITPEGTMILTVVNRWYLMEVLLNLIALRFKRAFARLSNRWRGYAEDKYLPSKALNPAEITQAFSHDFRINKKRGFSILYPPWYLHRRVPKWALLENFLWTADTLLNKLHLWPYGEYALYVLTPR